MTPMKTLFLSLAIITFGSGQVSAETFNFNPNLLVPDNGGSVSDSETISSSITSIQSIKVTLNISPVLPGAANAMINGDFWAYLQNSNGGGPNNAWLLNRIGTTDASQPTDAGNIGNGFAITLFDSAPQDIHLAPNPNGALPGGTLTGNWQPDARNTSPDSVTQGDLRSSFLSVFNNQSASGNWALFIGDASQGGGVAKVDSWSLEFTGVPEPTEWAAISGIALLGFGIWRKKRLTDSSVQV
jgi:hypothetical protein